METRKDKIKRLSKKIKSLKKEFKTAQREYTFIMIDDNGNQREYPWYMQDLPEFYGLMETTWNKMWKTLQKLNKARTEFRKEHIIASLRRGTPLDKIEQNVKRLTHVGYDIPPGGKPFKAHQWMFWSGDRKHDIEHAIIQYTINKYWK